MTLRLKEQFSGKGKLGLLRPSFWTGGARYLIKTALSPRKSEFYDAEREVSTEKPNVVVLPGFAGDIGPYEELAERLAQTMKVYAPSTLPRGLGAIVSPKGIEKQAALLLDYLDKIPNPNGQAINLAGHSNGGLMALLALRLSDTAYGNRHRIGRIITMASGLKPPAKNYIGSIPLVSQYYGAIGDLRYNSPIFSAISPYYDRVTLSLVSTNDELFAPDMMHVDESRARFYDTGHYGFFHKRHIGQTVDDINSALA